LSKWLVSRGLPPFTVLGFYVYRWGLGNNNWIVLNMRNYCWRPRHSVWMEFFWALVCSFACAKFTYPIKYGMVGRPIVHTSCFWLNPSLTFDQNNPKWEEWTTDHKYSLVMLGNMSWWSLGDFKLILLIKKIRIWLRDAKSSPLPSSSLGYK